MQTQNGNKPMEQLVAAIQAIDLDPIKLKLMDPEEGQGWSREYVDQMEIAYKRFLILVVTHPDETIAPTKDIDKFWHGHILDTMKYAEDCQNVFGYFLHHFPYLGMRGEEDAARHVQAGSAMYRLYQQEFGETIPSRSFMRAKEGAAMCGAAISMRDAAVTKDAAAMCGAVVRSERTAMCGAAVSMCGATVANDAAAMCGAAISMCGAAVTKDTAAMCGAVVRSERTAMCGAAVSMCGATVANDAAAMCGTAVSMCGVAKKADSVTALFGARKPAYRDKLNTSVRPKLALAA